MSSAGKLPYADQNSSFKAVWNYLSLINGHDQIKQQLHGTTYADVDFDNGLNVRTFSLNQIAISLDDMLGYYTVQVFDLKKFCTYETFSSHYQKMTFSKIDGSLSIQAGSNTIITLHQPR
ncbi:hypothetical protein Elgi_38810 [Paenibacillus elgii]|nr:hypothetical protein Elgi_38810 [Paenibacillus elgii]